MPTFFSRFYKYLDQAGLDNRLLVYRLKSFRIIYTIMVITTTIGLFVEYSIQMVFDLFYFITLLLLHHLFAVTHNNLFNIVYILSNIPYSLMVKYYDPDKVILPYLSAIISPVYCALFTGNTKLIIFNGIMQTYILNSLYRNPLSNVLLNNSVLYLTEELLSNAIIVMQFCVLLLVVMNMFLNGAHEDYSELKKQELETQQQFFLSISHELRNLLNSLLGSLQLALLEELPIAVRNILNTGQVCGELLLHLINNILDKGKVEMGELEIDPKPHSAIETIEKVWKICSELIRKKDIQGQLIIEKNMPYIINIDEHRFAQILLNLVGNAVKFTEKGLITLVASWIDNKERVDDQCFTPYLRPDLNKSEITIENPIKNRSRLTSLGLDDFSRSSLNSSIIQREKFNGVLRLAISDTGCGISLEDQKKLFQRFTQFSEDQSKRKIGTGLGLFITKGLVNKMQGDIRVQSTPGRGTTFIVCIPMVTCQPSPQIASGVRSFSFINSIKTIRALIVDDSRFDCSVFSEFLKKMKILDQEIVGDGPSALKAYEDSINEGNPFDIMIIDVEIPGMTGIELAEAVRSLEFRKNSNSCIIILVSDDVPKSEVKKCLDPSGKIRASEFLTKPPSYDAMRKVIIKKFYPLKTQYA